MKPPFLAWWQVPQPCVPAGPDVCPHSLEAGLFREKALEDDPARLLSSWFYDRGLGQATLPL